MKKSIEQASYYKDKNSHLAEKYDRESEFYDDMLRISLRMPPKTDGIRSKRRNKKS